MTVRNFFGYDELPPEAKAVTDPPCSEYDLYGYLVITWDDGSVEVHNDHMEPEDARFSRDLQWISPAIERAYKSGRGELL